MKKYIMTTSTALAVVLASCSRSRHLATSGNVRDSVRVETVIRTEYVRDTVFIEIPVERERQTVHDTTSHLETSFALSDARVNKDGTFPGKQGRETTRRGQKGGGIPGQHRLSRQGRAKGGDGGDPPRIDVVAEDADERILGAACRACFCIQKAVLIFPKREGFFRSPVTIPLPISNNK